MPYTPFVRLIKNNPFTSSRGRSRTDLRTGMPTAADRLSCEACGDVFAYGDLCPRCDVPLTPIVPEAA